MRYKVILISLVMLSGCLTDNPDGMSSVTIYEPSFESLFCNCVKNCNYDCKYSKWCDKFVKPFLTDEPVSSECSEGCGRLADSISTAYGIPEDSSCAPPQSLSGL